MASPSYRPELVVMVNHQYALLITHPPFTEGLTMPQVKFGTHDDIPFSFTKSDTMIAVRTRSHRSLRAGPVLSSAAAEVQDGTLLLAFPEAGVEVYQVPTDAAHKSLDSRKRSLRMMPDIQFAGSVLTDNQTGEPVVYTENIFIKFMDNAVPDQCRTIIHDAGLTIKREISYATNAFFLEAPEGTGVQVFDMALALLSRDDVEYCHPELIRYRAQHAIAPQQWHLKSTTLNGTPISASANVEAAHQITTGAGIVIAIIDDGIDIDHPDFSGAGKIVGPRDASQNNDNPRPKSPRDNHGTPCAGVACANGRKQSSGVAPDAKLMPIRLALNLGSQDEADAFAWAADNGADIISCSWGPTDGEWWNPDDPRHQRQVPLPPSSRLAMKYATDKGRDGKGCVILFAAGNGRESVDNDGYASYRRVMAIAACNDSGKRTVYSDYGQAIWCAFPSDDSGHAPFDHPAPLSPGIWTTDRRGTAGYNDGFVTGADAAGHYTHSFGGTSSACPGAAGVAALVLSVNPDLKWQHVRSILRRCCDKIDPQEGQYDERGHSPFYGFGRLNAAKAVQLAQPEPRNNVIILRTFNTPLPDLQTMRTTLEVGETAPIRKLVVHIDITHTHIGDLKVTLIPPPRLASSPITLHNQTGGATRNLQHAFDAAMIPELANFNGQAIHGQWTLKIKDHSVGHEGILQKFGLEMDL